MTVENMLWLDKKKKKKGMMLIFLNPSIENFEYFFCPDLAYIKKHFQKNSQFILDILVLTISIYPLLVGLDGGRL